MKRYRLLSLIVAFVLISPPVSLWACACGCGIFDVGTSAMLPTQPGGMAYLEFAGMDQKQNWRGSSKGSSEDNSDKQIRTSFFTAGVQYMFDRSWGFTMELPYVSRYFKMADDNDNIVGYEHSAVGDIRLKGVYSGFFPDMSTGLTFGLKLPSGDYTYPNFDPDTEIGTGSTDLLFGAYHMGQIRGSDSWNWFVNGQLDASVLHAGGYRPGSEINAVMGGYYNRWGFDCVKIAPLAQIIGSYRSRDSGTLANSQDSGYQRILLAPGVELKSGATRIYADIGFPVYQYFNGNQLTAAELFKLNVGYGF